MRYIDLQIPFSPKLIYVCSKYYRDTINVEYYTGRKNVIVDGSGNKTDITLAQLNSLLNNAVNLYLPQYKFINYSSRPFLGNLYIYGQDVIIIYMEKTSSTSDIYNTCVKQLSYNEDNKICRIQTSCYANTGTASHQLSDFTNFATYEMANNVSGQTYTYIALG